MARRLAAIGFAAVMASIGLVGDVWAHTPDEVDARLNRELHFRTVFGLATDRDFVRQLIRDSRSDTAYGVALTSAELIEMNRRVAIQDAMTGLEVYAEAQPGFAGHWIDQPAGGVITVAFKAEVRVCAQCSAAKQGAYARGRGRTFARLSRGAR